MPAISVTSRPVPLKALRICSFAQLRLKWFSLSAVQQGGVPSRTTSPTATPITTSSIRKTVSKTLFLSIMPARFDPCAQSAGMANIAVLAARSPRLDTKRHRYQKRDPQTAEHDHPQWRSIGDYASGGSPLLPSAGSKESLGTFGASAQLENQRNLGAHAYWLPIQPVRPIVPLGNRIHCRASQQ